MQPLALSLILVSTICHAYWNLLLKKTQGGITTLWLFTLCTVIFYIPILKIGHFDLSVLTNTKYLFFLLFSIIFHVLYFLLLNMAYKIGDLSLIYPIARGSSPLIVLVIAVIFYQETLNIIQFASILMIIFGTFFLSDLKISMSGYSVSTSKGLSIVYALLCGIMVAAYTLMDKYIVTCLDLSPLLLDFTNNIGRVILLMPFVLKSVRKQSASYKVQLKEIILIGILSPFSYLLILYAMQYAPISLIAPMRQLSILMSAILGIKILKEALSVNKIIGISMMVVGAIMVNF